MIVRQVTKILDGNMKSSEDFSKIILHVSDVITAVSKRAKDYENTVEMVRDHEINTKNKVNALFSNNVVNDIYVVKRDEMKQFKIDKK